MPELNPIDRVRAIGRIDLAPSHRQPPAPLVLFAAAASVVGSIFADAILVKLGTSLFPSTKGFADFRLSDYGVLTVVGVVVASAAWPVVTRITSTPRWLFLRLAALVTLVLWLPDVWLLAKGEPAKAVAVLMVMHLAIALVTYNLLVHLAPVGQEGATAAPPGPGVPATADVEAAPASPLEAQPGQGAPLPVASPPADRSVWIAMAWASVWSSSSASPACCSSPSAAPTSGCRPRVRRSTPRTWRSAGYSGWGAWCCWCGRHAPDALLVSGR